MKPASLFLFALQFIVAILNGQIPKTELKSKTIIEQRVIELNGGARASFGGKSRTYIKIDLPANTKEWYYSFTTAPGASGTQNLNLGIQLSALLLDPSGITSSALKSVKVPPGTSSADIYLCDKSNIDLFANKVDNNGGRYRSIMEGTVENTSQALVRVDDVRQGTWYLGLKNPSSLDGIAIFVEVVAITEDAIQKTPEQEKAELYASLGWKAYERGEYDKCLELSSQALKLDPEAGWVHNNIGLIKLIKGDFVSAIENYSIAISYFKKTDRPKLWLEAAIKDLNELIMKHGSLEGSKDMLETLLLAYRQY